MGKSKPKKIRGDKIEELKRIYPTMSNKDVAEHFNMCVSGLQYWVAKLHLRKTPEYMAELKARILKKMHVVNKLNKYAVQIRGALKNKQNFRFKPLPKYSERPPEQQKEISEKISTALKARWAKERARLNFGLDPQTKWRVQEFSRPRASAKGRLLRRGYKFIEKWIFEYNADTDRSALVEKRCIERFKFKFRENTDER